MFFAFSQELQEQSAQGRRCTRTPGLSQASCPFPFPRPLSVLPSRGAGQGKACAVRQEQRMSVLVSLLNTYLLLFYYIRNSV